MRLWSLHPMYLDQKGLSALWREALLAQKVLLGETTGYVNHPQLDRFKRAENPLQMIKEYLYHIRVEGLHRGYDFKLERIRGWSSLKITFSPFSLIRLGQITLERDILDQKIKRRNGTPREILPQFSLPHLHPCFEIGPMIYLKEEWEHAESR